MKKIMFVFLLCVGGVLVASAKTIAFWPFGAEGGRDATGQGNDLEYDANVQIGETAVLNGKHTLFSTKNVSRPSPVRPRRSCSTGRPTPAA